MRALRDLLFVDETIRNFVADRVGPEGEQSLQVLPAITYLLTSGVAELDVPIERPVWKFDVWAARDKPQQVQRLTDAIDGRLRGQKTTTDAGRRLASIERVTVWSEVPDPDARHRTSTWQMVTI